MVDPNAVSIIYYAELETAEKPNGAHTHWLFLTSYYQMFLLVSTSTIYLYIILHYAFYIECICNEDQPWLEIRKIWPFFQLSMYQRVKQKWFSYGRKPVAIVALWFRNSYSFRLYLGIFCRLKA